jgi:hypothetical protein
MVMLEVRHDHLLLSHTMSRSPLPALHGIESVSKISKSWNNIASIRVKIRGGGYLGLRKLTSFHPTPVRAISVYGYSNLNKERT